MKIAICDDNPIDCQTLRRYLETYLGENVFNDVTLKEYESGEALLAESTLPELLFLDIFMENINGMDVARRLLERGYTGGIVFITTSKEFGAESYEVNALDYLVKPYTYERFSKSMIRCNHFLQGALATISIPSGRKEIEFLLRELLYIETGNHCLLFHTQRETVKSPMTMEQAEQLLSRYPTFIRCHRSFIINLTAVEDVTDVVTMTNGDQVLLNIKNATALRRRIADFIWREMEARHD